MEGLIKNIMVIDSHTINMASQKIKFSIVIPTYNQSEFLSKALDSILGQTYTNWEVIIIDNNSIDNTQTIIESYQDHRIKSYKIKNDGVIALSRNLGIEKSNGEYISFLDSDDFWFPNKLERVLSYINSNYNLIYHSEIWKWNTNFEKLKYSRPVSNNFFRNLLFVGNSLSTSAVTVERELMRRQSGFSVDRNFIGVEDYELWLRLAKDQSTSAFCINEPLGVFIVHAQSNSRKLQRQFNSEMNVLNYHFSNCYYKKFTDYILFFIRICKCYLSYSIVGQLRLLIIRLLTLTS